jgi:cytochrome oxidase Cu insertion factor (SCO1/SenC/PrrC family)
VPEPAWRKALATVSFGSVTALGALAIVLLGTVPMAAASANRTADPVLAEAIAGYSPPLNDPAPPFTLTSQHGATVSLASLRGKVVLLTFLDPVCTTDCTLMGREFLQAGTMLARDAGHVELVGIVVNPVYYSTAVVNDFDQQEGMSALPNWDFLTASPGQLARVWKAYGITGQVLPAGSMIGHNDLAYVIDASGHIRQEVDFDPGPGNSATMSSFASLLAGDARQLLGASGS